MKHLNIPVSDELHEQVRVYAFNTRQSVAVVVRQAVRDFITEKVVSSEFPVPRGLPKPYASDLQIGKSVISHPEHVAESERVTGELRKEIDVVLVPTSFDTPLASKTRHRLKDGNTLPSRV